MLNRKPPKKTRVISMRVTDTERTALARIARKHKCTVAALLRRFTVEREGWMESAREAQP